MLWQTEKSITGIAEVPIGWVWKEVEVGERKPADEVQKQTLS
jgi:hypothetical protein